jgi:hypothetical protein
MMSDKLDWTKALGDAVLAQQADVMDAIQRLRLKAHDNKKLTSTREQKVTIQQQESKQVILIEPTDPDTLYVPYYDPAVMYGEWPYPDYPPYYFAAPAYIGAGLIATGLVFGAGFAVGRWSNYWGGGCNWGNNNFFINRSNNTNNIGNNWLHNPAHRQGVRYSSAGVQQKFGNNDVRAGAADRMDYRGRDGQKVLDAGKDRAGAGNRGGASDRGGADRASGDRAKAGDRARTVDGTKTGNRAKGGDRARTADRSRAAAAGKKGGRDTAIRNVSSGRAANVQSARGRASFASVGGSRVSMSGGGFRAGGGGAALAGGGRGGGFGGGGGRGGGRRSDIALKHDVVLLGHLDQASVITVSAISAAIRPMSASSRRKCRPSCPVP